MAEKPLTTKQVGERLGIKASRVRQLILRGDLPSEKFGHIHLIRATDVENLKRNPAGYPKGRPRESERE